MSPANPFLEQTPRSEDSWSLNIFIHHPESSLVPALPCVAWKAVFAVHKSRASCVIGLHMQLPTSPPGTSQDNWRQVLHRQVLQGSWLTLYVKVDLIPPFASPARWVVYRSLWRPHARIILDSDSLDLLSSLSCQSCSVSSRGRWYSTWRKWKVIIHLPGCIQEQLVKFRLNPRKNYS